MTLAGCCETFRDDIHTTAIKAGMTDAAVYVLWERYAQQCDWSDQSPVWPEFLRWNEKPLKPKTGALHPPNLPTDWPGEDGVQAFEEAYRAWRIEIGDPLPDPQASWIDRHSVNCFKCGELVDERECIPGKDGEGDICPACLSMIMQEGGAT